MKTMKGKLLKKLKSIKPAVYLKQERILQVFAADALLHLLPKRKPTSPKLISNSNPVNETSFTPQDPDLVDVTELLKDLEDDEEKEEEEEDKTDTIDSVPNKENIKPNCADSKTSTIFRKPELDSSTLFDPDLLALFNQAVTESTKCIESQRRSRTENNEDLDLQKESKTRRIVNNEDLLMSFEENCPPGGEKSVIFYTTSLRGIRKTFEDCRSIRFLLQSLKVSFYERDVSMHKEYRDELWRIGGEKTCPPKLFVMGRYIGGAQEVSRLHEQGKLKMLFENVAVVKRRSGERLCIGCDNVRFVVCSSCNGSRRVVGDGDGGGGGAGSTGSEGWRDCSVCNENGLVVCPICL